MNLLTMAKLGITVISGLILSVGSVGNYTTSPITAEENLELEGCAARFTCPTGTLPFHYDYTDYEQHNVEDVTKWLPGYNPDSDCGGDDKACLICVSSNFIIIDGEEMTLDEELEIETEETESNIYKVNRLPNDDFSAVSNRDN